jgi:hypothetical protein
MASMGTPLRVGGRNILDVVNLACAVLLFIGERVA